MVETQHSASPAGSMHAPNRGEAACGISTRDSGGDLLMKSTLIRTCTFILLAIPALSLDAQTFPSPNYFQQLFRYPHVQTQLQGPESLDEYIVNGKLRLDLQSAIRLMLLNNTDVRINQTQL